MPKVEKYVTESLGAEVLVRSTNQSQTTYAVAASLSELELKKILIDKMEANKSIKRADTQRTLYNAMVASYNSDKDIISSYRDVEYVIGETDEQPNDKEATKADWFKKPEKPSTLDSDWSKRRQIDFQPPQTWISHTARTKEPPTSFDEFNATTFDFSAFVLKRIQILNLTQELLVGPAFNLLKGTSKSLTELEYHPEEYCRGRQIIPKDHFINKDLEYMKSGDLSRSYSNSVTKTKAASYDLKWIEDIFYDLWCPSVVKYDQYALYDISHWGSKRKSFYCYASNLTSSKDVYSRRRIIAVTRLKIKRKYDYGYLEEIEVRRDDQQIYMFKEGYFSRLRLQDIEEMLPLLTQRRLTNLTVDERYDLNVALRVYTRRIVIQKRVKDLQLGVESYQKKLNLTKPDTYRSHLWDRTAYTSHSDPHRIIYLDQSKRKRLMRTDELHKFSDGTLNDVRTALHDIDAGLRMEYLPMQK
nr:hypothetical protein [Tanacetum cinerariifolium]